MTTWEYATVPLIVHATKQILDQWGEDGWELVQVVPGPDGSPVVMELEVTEPCLFLRLSPGAVDRFAAAVVSCLG